MEKNYFDAGGDLRSLIQFFNRNRKTFLIAFAFSVIAALIAYFITPKRYMAQAVVFPTESNSVENSIGNPQVGYDVEADRLLQILGSQSMQDSIVKMYDLVKYYEIDTTSPSWRYTLAEEYDRDVHCERTRYMSIQITVRTMNAELSAAIANSVVDMANRLRDKIYKSNMVLALQSLEREYLMKRQTLDTLIQKINVLKSEKQAGNLVLTGNQFFNFDNSHKENMTELEIMVNQYNHQQGRVNEAFNKYENARLAYQRPLSKVYQVDTAVANHRKVSPRLRVNLIVSFVVVMLFTSIIVLVRERLRASLQD